MRKTPKIVWIAFFTGFVLTGLGLLMGFIPMILIGLVFILTATGKI